MQLLMNQIRVPRFSALIKKKVLDYTTIIVIGVQVVRFAPSLTMNIVLGLNGFILRVSFCGMLNSG